MFCEWLSHPIRPQRPSVPTVKVAQRYQARVTTIQRFQSLPRDSFGEKTIENPGIFDENPMENLWQIYVKHICENPNVIEICCRVTPRSLQHRNRFLHVCVCARVYFGKSSKIRPQSGDKAVPFCIFLGELDNLCISLVKQRKHIQNKHGFSRYSNLM